MKYRTKEIITVLLLATITLSFFFGRWTAECEYSANVSSQVHSDIKK